jgi:tetratricopeptide (TPR) repeat protein
MGYPEQALRDYQEALKLWEEKPTNYEGGCIYMGIYASYRALGMLKDALAIAQEGLRRFPEEDPGLYQNLADADYAMGWRNDAINILKKGIEKFPEDEELKSVLKDIEEDMDDPDGEKPPILGLILLMAFISKRLRKRK